MFKRYTEKARRVIYFARFEAGNLGGPSIETDYLLLGMLQDNSLSEHYFGSVTGVEAIRREIEGRKPGGEKIPSSVAMPLSAECKRVLGCAEEEADRLGHQHVGTDHLLLGLLREEKCFAAQILQRRGLHLTAIREELARLQGRLQEQLEESRSARALPLSAGCAHLLRKAAMEAQRLGHQDIHPEHVLVAILLEEDCLAARILREEGLTLASLRERLARQE